jgi:small subunit ribosomal protein S20
MPIIKSAKKRVKVAAKASARNARTKRNLREALKAFASALEDGKPAEIAKAQSSAISALDTAAKKAVMHKNKAARQKARLAAQAKAAGVKASKTTAKKVTKKAPVKKPSAKKAVAKKASSKTTSKK